MEYKGYTADAVYDSDSQTYSGVVLNISDTVHFEAETIEQAEVAFRESIDDYIALCESEGAAPNTPSTGELRIHLDPSVYIRLLAAARDAGDNVDHFIAAYLGQAFAKH